jgi:hypothetical protein
MERSYARAHHELERLQDSRRRDIRDEAHTLQVSADAAAARSPYIHVFRVTVANPLKLSKPVAGET